jgi:hypothetical protein
MKMLVFDGPKFAEGIARFGATGYHVYYENLKKPMGKRNPVSGELEPVADEFEPAEAEFGQRLPYDSVRHSSAYGPEHFVNTGHATVVDDKAGEPEKKTAATPEKAFQEL